MDSRVPFILLSNIPRIRSATATKGKSLKRRTKEKVAYITWKSVDRRSSNSFIVVTIVKKDA
jgi:hypothetical protein